MKQDKLFAQLVPKAVMGIRSDITQNIQFFSQDKLAYVAGNYVIIYTIKEKIQNFFPANSEYGEITSFSIDEYNDSIILAIAQKSISMKAVIYVRYLNKNFLNSNNDNIKTAKLTLSDIDANDYFTSISVNVLKGYIIALVGPRTPSAVAIFQNDLRNGTTKILSVVNMASLASYKIVQINVFNPFMICVYGEGGFAVIQINDQDKRTVTKLEIDPRTLNYQEFSNFIFSFVASCWISKSRIAVINSASDIFLLEFHTKNKLESNYKKAIKNVNIFETQSRARGIFQKNGNLFVCRDDGIIVKLEDKQQNEKIMVYEKTNNASRYVQNMPKMDVQCVSINNPINSSTTYFALGISSTNSQIYYIDISNDSNITDGNNYKFLISQFHGDSISSIDVAKQKSLVVSCSKDKFIKIWNYNNNFNLELSQFFEDEPLKVAIHPSGLYLGVLFREKFQLMEILEKKIVVFREIAIGDSNEMKFSHFGHFFSICFKNSFYIYNFYTCEIIFTSKSGIHNHTDEIKTLVWNDDDSGFATCGLDGRMFYWQLHNTEEHQIIKFSNKDSKFTCVNIMNILEEVKLNKKIFLMDSNNVMEINNTIEKNEEEEGTNKVAGNAVKTKVGSDETNDPNSVKRDKFKVLMSGYRFSQFHVDGESKLFIATSYNEHIPCIHVSSYPFILDKKHFISYQAHSSGVNAFRISHDMNNLFTGGNDKSVFFFYINNSHRSDRHDENLDTQNLILLKKDELDIEMNNLESKLNKINQEIDLEQENCEMICQEIQNEYETLKKTEFRDKERFAKEKLLVEEMNRDKNIHYKNLIYDLVDAHEKKIQLLDEQHEDDKFVKNKEIEKENENLKNAKIKDEALNRQSKKANDEELVNIKENFVQILANLKLDINKLEEKCSEIEKIVENEKSEIIEANDNAITIKRSELETFKKNYDKIKIEHQKLEEKLKSEIFELKTSIKHYEAKRIEDKNQLVNFQADNLKLIRSISELQNDKKEKENTIVEKNILKRSLEIENQELEKFKFVLNYKIKELKHEKDPKESKLASLEKQARDMEKEIKNFEKAQANYIVDLSTHHQIMKLHHKQISETENSIDRLKNYIKIFKNSLYNSMKVANNPAQLKKELIHLKELFLDKEFLDENNNPDKEDHELDRQLLEMNLVENKNRIEYGRSLLNQDFAKIMRENKHLLLIVNELEKEKKEIESASFEAISLSKSSNHLKPKMNLKESLPVLNNRSSLNLDQKVSKLKDELFKIEREIHFKKESFKKEQLRKKKKKKNLRYLQLESIEENNYEN